MPAQFMVLPPVTRTNWKILGLGIAERATLMLEKAGLSRSPGIRGSGDLVIYPAELVGPPKLGIELASQHLAPGEIVELTTGVDDGRPVYLVQARARDRLAQRVESGAVITNAAAEMVTRRASLRTKAVHVVDADSRSRARNLLLASLRKSVDGLVSRNINRPISIAISSILAGTPITPNMMSIVTFVVSLAGAAMMAGANFVAGGMLLQLSSILDGCDGEIARLKYQSSRLGAWLDTVLDDVSTAVFMIATGWGLHSHYGGTFGQALLWICVGSVALTLPAYIVTYSRLIRTNSTDTGAISWSDTPNPSAFRRFLVEYLQPWSKRDGYYLLFMMFAVAGVPWLIAIFYSIGATLVTGTILTDRSPADARYHTGRRPAGIVTARFHLQNDTR